MAPTLNCPCGSDRRTIVFDYDSAPEGETAFDLRGQIYRRSYACCDHCGHYVSVTGMDLNFLYDGAYVNQTYGDRLRQTFQRIIALPPEKSDNEGRARYVLAEATVRFSGRQAPSLMDVGAGLGVFPWRMKQAGWHVTALDPDTRTARHAREVVGVEGIAADFFDLQPDQVGQFDVLTFNKVLEHVADPIAMLAKAAGFLAPGGFVYVELPDVAAAAKGKGREEFFIEHHHVFSMASYAILAEKAGFQCLKVERLIEPSGKYTLRGIMAAHA